MRMGLIVKKNDVYKNISYVIKKEEKFDKKREVITGVDLLSLGIERFKLMKALLRPLVNKLNKEQMVQDVSFLPGLQNEAVIRIQFVNHDCVLLSYSFIDNTFDFLSYTFDGKYHDLILKYQKIVLECFRSGIDNNFFDEDEYQSTSLGFNARLLNTKCEVALGNYANNFLKMAYSFDESCVGDINWDKLLVESNMIELGQQIENNKDEIFRNIRFYKSDFVKVLRK